MATAFGLIIVGAGPAGMAAAIAAAGRGIDTLLLDEQDQAGGQYYRALPAGVNGSPRRDPHHLAGDALRARLYAGPAKVALQRKVWHIRLDAAPGGPATFTLQTLGANGNEIWTSRALIVASGTTERVIPFAGWTTPGVMGLAGASILLKAHQMLPGGRTVVAGSGPLLALVAAGIIAGGGTVAAVVDLAGTADWLRALPGLATRPALLRQGVSWLLRLKRAGVPIFTRHTVVNARGRDGVESVDIQPVDAQRRIQGQTAPRTLTADSLVIGHGLTPAGELLRASGVTFIPRPDAGGWVPDCDDYMRTSVPGLFAAGDCAGVAGAETALLRGRLAGLAASALLAGLPDDQLAALTAATRRELRQAARFSGASAALMAMPAGLADSVAPEVVVCRCEGVTLAQIDSALDAGASELNQLKIWSGCAMGSCQGRFCAEMLEHRLRRRALAPRVAGPLRARPPARPLSVSALLGEDDGAPLILPEKRP
ncbi:NAD(P)/FAD-dependent oxidoreductase [Sodalis sp. RH21]|uniref:FAD/NAD(P)-dependent oxidoreductase n=1 Tax=unclassified Sodalis (in: enterobacteria) TaxID=2636512 RepID=UPI0039B4A4BC